MTRIDWFLSQTLFRQKKPLAKSVWRNSTVMTLTNGSAEYYPGLTFGLDESRECDVEAESQYELVLVEGLVLATAK